MVGFSEQNARRVVKATRASERDQFHPKQYSFNTAPQTTAQNFIPVKIMGVELGSSGSQNLHSWVRVELGSNGTWTEKPDWEKGGPDYNKPESSLLHPDNLAIEPGTVVLAHWSIDQGYLLAETDHIVAYKLQQNMTAMNLEAEAKAVDGSGTEYGPAFKVVMEPFLYNQFGPALQGWFGYGYFSPKRNESLDPPNQQLNVIYQQRFAMGIDWQVSGGLEDCEAIAQVVHHWNGEQPQAVKVKLPSCFDCGCYSGEQCGSASYCPDESTDQIQVYHITLLDQLTCIEKLDECATDACTSGTATKNIRIGDGLKWERRDCESFGCLGVLSNPGVKVTGIECSSGSSGSSGSEVLEIDFQAPLAVELDNGCPSRATVTLGNFIEAAGDSCITLTATSSGCKVYLNASFDPDCCSSGTTIVEPGTCIDVDVVEDPETNTKTYTVNNTMTLTGGTCIGVSGEGCEKTINNLMTLTAGDCLSVSGEGCSKTIANTMSVVGGDGIKVTKSGCAYSVSLAGSQADPKTSLRLLCDVDIELTPISISCVETSGGWSFESTGGELTVTKKYTTITLPGSLIEVESDCGSSGSFGCADCPNCEEGFEKIISTTGECDCISHSQSISEGWAYCNDPTFACDDCPECEEGYARIMELATGDCDCYALSVPPMDPPEGFIYCDSIQHKCEDCEITCPEGQDLILDPMTGECACHTFGDPPPEGWSGYSICPTTPTPDGQGVQLNGLDCDAVPPHVSFTFLGMPTGASSYMIVVTGDKGSSATIGPSFDHEEIPQQEYWGALNEGWSDVQEGECFAFDVVFDNGFTQAFTGCCP